MEGVIDAGDIQRQLYRFLPLRGHGGGCRGADALPALPQTNAQTNG
jgi:hypothetical protein